MTFIESLRKTPWVSGDRPYLVNRENQSALAELLSSLDMQVIVLDVPLDASVPKLLAMIGEGLEFPSSPPAIGWASLKDYYWDFVRLGHPPAAVVLSNADRLLDYSIRRFITVVHNLLSMTGAIGLSTEVSTPIEYFFVGPWGSSQ